MKAIKSVFLFLFISFPAAGQNIMTSSPYSMFGIGEIITGLRGQNSAMGGVAYGSRGLLHINTDNPAGLVGLDSCTLIAEISGFGKFESYLSNGNSNDAFTGNVSAFMMGGRIVPRWYAAVSVTPYSSVGYYFQSTQDLEGSPGSTVESVFEGSGGLSKASLSHAFLLPGDISIGTNLSYVFGNMTQDESQETMSVSQRMKARSFYADVGVQYRKMLNKNTVLILGAVYGYRQKLYINNTKTVTTSTSSTETPQKGADQYLPQFAGLGGNLTYRKMTYALDYTFYQYSSLKSGDARITFNDTHELRSGICYSPKGSSSDSYWKRMNYKAGINVSTNYLSISGNNGISWKASAGIEFPIRNGKFNTSFFYENLTLQNNKLKSSTFGITISYTIAEIFHRIKL